MVLIIAPPDDHTVHDVMDWLRFKAQPYYRISRADLATINFSVAHNNTWLDLPGHGRLSLAQITAVWFRRSADIPHWHDSIPAELHEHAEQEYKASTNALLRALATRPSLGHPDKMQVDKLEVLNLAQQLGFVCPASMITNQKESLLAFKAQYPSLVMKALRPAPPLVQADGTYLLYTTLLDDAAIAAFPDQFLPTFFQQAIPKLYDIRIFYLDGKCWAIAIFPPAGSGIDVRQQAAEAPKVPWAVPDDLALKINALMQALGLNTGSLDFVAAPDDAFYFLELNPVGQFSWVSKAANYNLEEAVAGWLACGGSSPDYL